MHKLNKTAPNFDPSNRLYQLQKPIIGLTGCIATGKTTVANYLTDQGLPLIDADKLVKKIYSLDESIEFIKETCPAAINNGLIDFKILRNQFFSNSDKKEAIEAYIYQKMPLVFKEELQKFNQDPHQFIIYDVPLLFEKKLEEKLDLSVVVYCPENVQLNRLMHRDKMDKESALKIMSHQISIEKKKELADYTIDNSQNLDHLHRQVDQFLSESLC